MTLANNNIFWYLNKATKFQKLEKKFKINFVNFQLIEALKL